MNKQYLSIIIGTTAALMVAAGAAYLYLYDVTDAQLVRNTPPAAKGDTLSSDVGNPVRIGILKLGIETELEPVGRTASGAMANPSSFSEVAWFREGAAPGEQGSAVVAGHLDNALGMSGVFKELHTLESGDEINIYSDDGEVRRFRVLHTQDYHYLSPPPDLFTRSDGVYLNLITCAGNWLRQQQTYERRLVVYAELMRD